MKKNLPASAGNFFLRIASESEKVFARILNKNLGVLISQKSVFKWTNNSKFHDLDLSHYILKMRIISFSSKKVFLMVIVNMKVYKRTCFKRDHVIMYEYLYYMYI